LRKEKQKQEVSSRLCRDGGGCGISGDGDGGGGGSGGGGGDVRVDGGGGGGSCGNSSRSSSCAVPGVGGSSIKAKVKKLPKVSLHKLLCDQRIPMREASIQAVLEIFRVTIRIAAARPRDANGRIRADSLPMFQLFNQHPLYRHFSETGPNPVFALTAFRQLCADIRGAEDRVISFTTPQSESTVVGLGSATMAAIQAVIRPEMDRVLALFESSIQRVVSTRTNPSARSEGEVVGGPSEDGLGLGTLVRDGNERNDTDSTAMSDGTSGQFKKELSRQNHVDPSKGHETMTEFGKIRDAEAMLAVYYRETALEAVKKSKWRNYRGGMQAWYSRGPLFRHINCIILGASSKLSGDTAALASLSTLTNEKGSLGGSKAPNWAGIVSDLRKTQLELDLISQKKKRATEYRAAYCKQAKHIGGGENNDGSAIPVMFHRDGSIVEDAPFEPLLDEVI
jgi:hypothetical protein